MDAKTILAANRVMASGLAVAGWMMVRPAATMTSFATEAVKE